MDGFDRELVPLRAKRAELDADPGRLTQALADGAEKARRIASETLREVRGVMGLGGHG
jgi:tryptophanyl-tRNA synthetase